MISRSESCDRILKRCSWTLFALNKAWCVQSVPRLNAASPCRRTMIEVPTCNSYGDARPPLCALLLRRCLHTILRDAKYDMLRQQSKLLLLARGLLFNEWFRFELNLLWFKSVNIVRFFCLDARIQTISADHRPCKQLSSTCARQDQAVLVSIRVASRDRVNYCRISYQNDSQKTSPRLMPSRLIWWRTYLIFDYLSIRSGNKSTVNRTLRPSCSLWWRSFCGRRS